MRLTTLAASLISAGIATIITASVVEKRLLAEFDERMQEELEASVSYLEQTGKAEPTEHYEEKHKILFGTKFDNSKPSVEEVANKNQRVRYDQVVKKEGYFPPGETVVADDGTMMLSEIRAEGELEVCETLGDLHPISTDEFMENESGYFQSTLYYFVGDGAVLDEDQDPVAEQVDMIGEAVPPFGELSGEPHIVYLRNNRLRREFEVVMEEGKAADVISAPASGEVP